MAAKDSLIIENGPHRRKAVLSVDWHPSGRLLATGDYGNEEDSLHSVKIWTDQGQLLSEDGSHQKEIRALAWNNTGEVLATGGETIRLWNKEGKLLTIFEENSSPVWSMDWKDDGTQIASGHSDGKIRFWSKDGQLMNVLEGHSSELITYSFNKDQTKVILGYSDGVLRYFDLASRTNQTIKAHDRSVTAIAWTHDEELVALSSNDGTCSIWYIGDGTSIKKNASFGTDRYPKHIAWDENDASVAYLENGNISVWSKQGVYQYEHQSAEKVNAVVWKNGQVTGTWVDKDASTSPKKVYFKSKGKRLELIPLNNNRFALLDSLGTIIYGDKRDFIKLEELDHGFTKLHSLK